MKLATYQDGSRDGQLVVVSRDLSQAHFATGIATRLQQVLDDWNFLSPQLDDLAITLNHGKARHAFAFDPKRCMAPLPRTHLRVEAAACPHHETLLRLAAGLAAGLAADAEPALALHLAGSDQALGPAEDAEFGLQAWGIDCAATLAVVTGDVGMGASAEQGLDGVRLLLLGNQWQLRALAAAELALGHGPLQCLPPAAWAPVAVTPDELGEAWQRGRVNLTLQTSVNGRKLGTVNAGRAMAWHFGQLVAHLAKTRAVRAGSIVGAGVVSGGDDGAGPACLAEKRAQETVAHGAPRTPWLAHGDRVRIEMKAADGHSVFGAIDQRVRTADAPPEPAADEADVPTDATDPTDPTHTGA